MTFVRSIVLDEAHVASFVVVGRLEVFAKIDELAVPLAVLAFGPKTK